MCVASVEWASTWSFPFWLLLAMLRLYHSEQEPERAGPKSIFDARHAKVLEVNEAQPCHLQSVIQRILELVRIGFVCLFLLHASL